ncbi:class I SAM-dependent methyltransferase [Promicromonospora thailandica]|uniref:16S rRNA (Guanine1207-N2)-methyltransferase n=1 Tax=Promicromonospora thailandica TaxID=765201 RepID=A0A9X2G2V7_9MICO|nr:methyltransferase [Promicromonospora thailandica]MCP2264463.1 16S rRNA (guanine1207-N2)-methyltransferase [Promicromonospora thailandica]BFF20478.1 methyltransferase [Promicromonospora thailandica]
MNPEVESALAALRPYPEDGSRADGPVAVDATDRLLLDEAATLLTPEDDRVVIIGDRFGALTLGALALGARHVDVHTDAVTAETALRANSDPAARTADRPDADPTPGYTLHDSLSPDLLRGARLVLLQLPTSLAELTEIAEHVAREADPAVILLAGGRVKHMTRAMNDVLGASFRQVSASLARQKSRLLIAREPRPDVGPLTYPVTARLTDPEIAHALAPARQAAGLAVVAHGAAFAGAGLDLGTRFLLAQAHRWPASPAVAVDLGCGTGILAAVLALRSPATRVIATDRSAAACASARATLAANGVAGTVLRDDAGAALADDSADLVLLNPPFHDRAALSTDAAHRMFATAGRVLRDGGELWTVFNTGLHYRNALERAVGPTEHVAQNTRFTVTRSVRKLLTDVSVEAG